MKLGLSLVSIDRKEVLRLIGCEEDSPVLGAMIADYEEILPDIMEQMRPDGMIGVSQLRECSHDRKYPSGTKVLYVMVTVGREISAYSSHFFEQGDYVKGMLVDAAADVALSQLEMQWQNAVKELCQRKKWGIAARLEAPKDIAMKVQRDAWEALSVQEVLDIHITEGYMYDPIKTLCNTLVLTEEKDRFAVAHECKGCENLSCRMRSPDGITITVSEDHQFVLQKGISLKEGLLQNGYELMTPCGGRGICGACRIKEKKGRLEVTKEDINFFTEEEIEEGYRLACTAYPQMDCEIELIEIDHKTYRVVTECRREYKEGGESAKERSRGGNRENINERNQEGLKELDKDNSKNDLNELGIAIDIGTTTRAVQLVDIGSNMVLATYTGVNQQRRFGADVLSRIQAWKEGKGACLRKSIQEDLLKGMHSVMEDYGAAVFGVKEVVIAANTTMIHLLLGYPCEKLGEYPFEPHTIEQVELPFYEVFGREYLHCKVVVLPGISAFVGADIVAGMLCSGFAESNKVNLLVDLGTNGEMAIGTKDQIVTASTAAGPAFEGGSIQCGMSSVDGAIVRVWIDQETGPIVETIGDQEPRGLCGSGALEAVAELWKHTCIDNTGLFIDDFFEKGYLLAMAMNGSSIVLTQKDIREIQLAKAAIRAGIETLLHEYGVSYKDIHRVYLAGGFGYALDPVKAAAIGLLPPELSGKIIAAGNVSLGGAVYYLTEKQAGNEIRSLVKASNEIDLSRNLVFQEQYIDHMLFTI